MKTELLALIVAYFGCSDLAEQRHLTIEEVDMCNAVYLNVKLAFVPGVDTAHYVRLSSRERHAVNQAGYLAFLDWQDRNPETVDHLQRIARGDAQLDRDG